jgi:hypothetical protein
MNLTFKQEKETKNTVRYQEQGDGDIVIGPLYVQKSALGDNPPEELSITINVDESQPEDEDDGMEGTGDPDVTEPFDSEEVEKTA